MRETPNSLSENIFLIILIMLVKIIAYFFILFLINLKRDLYPYGDIGGGIYPDVVVADALAIRLLFSFMGFIAGSLSTWISFWGLRANPDSKVFQLIFSLLIISSALEMFFCGFRYFELKNLSTWLDTCEKSIHWRHSRLRSCYFP